MYEVNKKLLDFHTL